jgi:flagellin-like protein
MTPRRRSVRGTVGSAGADGRDRAQSSPIAVVLLLGMVIAGAGVVVGVGSIAIEETTEQTELARVEHALTMFDARTAMVGLGETTAQAVPLGGRAGGRYVADPDAGWLRITHLNYSGTDDAVVYNQSLGSLRYTNGESEVAYQGGGVWRRTDGGTVMVSPPEFHYRDATLTLPVIRVVDGDAAGGPTTTAFVDRADPTRRIYPVIHPDGDEERYPNGERYLNPVRNGTVRVTVKSRYYEGWASYFDVRTTGLVTVDHDSGTATVELKTVGQVGDFVLPPKGESVTIRGKERGHSVNDFAVTVAESGGTFNNMHFSFYAIEGARQYEVLVRVNAGSGGCDVKEGETLSMWVLYDDANDETGQHVWSNTSIPADEGPVRLECHDKDTRLVVDYMSDVPMTMVGPDGPAVPDRTGLAWDGTNAAAVSFNHSGYDEENETLTVDAADGFADTQTLGELNRHYLAMMGPSFELTVYHGGGNRGGAQIDGGSSTGRLFYETTDGSEYITFLHVTENNVSVTFR